MLMTDPEHCRRLFDLFGQCLELDPAARDTLLRAQATDPVLREALLRMLAADAAPGALDAGVVDIVDLEDLAAGAGADDVAAPGTHVGPWRLDRVLGRGGMGIVYAASREASDSAQRVALKHLHRRWDGSAVAQRFVQEHRILASLSHPHLPRLIDHGADAAGRPWFALEYVDGQPITDWADERRLGLRARIDVFRKVCAAVQHAHEHFIVHRDLKPANILVDREGHPKVLDFGVAKRTDETAGATRTGHPSGFTPEYAAPEQVTGGGISAATDVYALGVILYELLCGQLPYRLDQQNLRQATEAITSQTATQLEKALVAGPADEVARRLASRDTDLRAFRAFVKGDLSRIMQTALAKEPERRYSSVRAFSDDLQRLLAGRTVSVSGDTVTYRAGKFLQRNPWGVAMATLALIAIVGGSLALAWQADRTRREGEMAIRMKDYVVDMIRQSDLQSNANPVLARRALDHAAARLQTLPPDSVARLELLTLLLQLYSNRDLSHDGFVLALREVPQPPVWRDDRIDPVRLRAQIELARMYQENERGPEARAMLENALRDYPHRDDAASAEALTIIGETRGDEANHEAALHWHSEAMRIFEKTVDPGDHRLLLSRVLAAGALTSLRRSREARGLTERVLADLPAGDSLRAAYFLNMAALRRALFGEFASAHALMLRSRDMQRRLGHSRLRSYYVATRANNAIALGALAEARRDLDPQIREERAIRSRTHQPDLAELLLLRGEISFIENNAPDAAADFTSAAEALQATHSDSSAALYARAWLAIALVEADRMSDAKAALPALPARPPDYASVLAGAAEGRWLDREGDHAAAERAYARALLDLKEARTRPLVVHDQFREQRDEFRILGWQARAIGRAGDPARAQRLLATAVARGRRALGPQHPVVRVLQADEVVDASAAARSDP